MFDIGATVIEKWIQEYRIRRLRRSGSATMRSYRRQRISEIQSELAANPENFFYIAGDSHAEFFGSQAQFEQNVVNGGIGGITAPVYAAELRNLIFGSRACAAVVFIGSNDIAYGNKPLASRSIDRFEASVASIFSQLLDRVDRVCVAAIPPAQPNDLYPQVVEAIPLYNRLLVRAAAVKECTYFDPFAHMRDGDGGLAFDGFLRDGVHLSDYESLRESILLHLDNRDG